MSVEAKVDAGVLKIIVIGRFVFSVHNNFRDATKLAQTDIKHITIDLARTDYLDSSALGMLLLLRDKFIGDKNSIQIENAKKDVKKVLELANFNKLFKMD